MLFTGKETAQCFQCQPDVMGFERNRVGPTDTEIQMTALLTRVPDAFVDDHTSSRNRCKAYQRHAPELSYPDFPANSAFCFSLNGYGDACVWNAGSFSKSLSR